MALDLTLLPLRGPQQLTETLVGCRDRLKFDGDYELFCQLRDVHRGGNVPTIMPHPIPPQMWVETDEDEGATKDRHDRYGEVLTFVYAQQLKKLRLPDDVSPKNKAIMAFVEALPGDTPIILLWS